MNLSDEALGGMPLGMLDDVADELAEHGFVVVEHALPPSLLADLQTRIAALSDEEWQVASVGRDESQVQTAAIRSDRISWLTSSNTVEKDYLCFMENVREGLNECLFLGLFDFESYFATFSKGAFYQKHVDALKGRTNRRVSTVLYLNDDWQEHEGRSANVCRGPVRK
ncbi:MAG: 2OG-Fe(II) oxygenase [Deltaproteobacteria bacterium]|nr:2OG-Fe(II) oxygenase [Deltaproteobacteria bacterium]